MTSIDRESMPYRPCVGIAVMNAEGRIWIGQRIGIKEAFGDRHIWQMPQGGIDKNEDPWEAAKRELFEETGIREIELLAEASGWFNYDLPDEALGKMLKGKYRGQTQKWFAVRYLGQDDDIDILNLADHHDPEFDDWRWENIDSLPDLVVPFKRPVYEQVVAAFRHLVS